MKRRERKWMYESSKQPGCHKVFREGVDGFIDFAKRQQVFKNTSTIRCPCKKCENLVHLSVDDVKLHLYKHGFENDYYEWVCHGEEYPTMCNESVSGLGNPIQNMVSDAMEAWDAQLPTESGTAEEEPNPSAQKFFQMLLDANQPLFEGSKVSVLEVASRLANLKCEYNLPHRCVDAIVTLMQDIIPSENRMAQTFYQTKKVLRALELPHVRINVCRNGCMLFWRESIHLDKCTKCGKDRWKINSKGKRLPQKVVNYFPITPRLKRLFATKNIAEEMRWHHENPRAPGKMAHPSDGMAWKHFDSVYPDFASDPRNVRLGLCTDGFSPFGKFGASYSCWPIIITPYNLPPWLCMKKVFMFLAMMIPGSKNPKGNLHVYLQPLIEELQLLWSQGSLTYDVSKKQNFMIRAALMWTISDFPAYGMLSGWSTAGKLACPCCIADANSFWLVNGRKVPWFDCHRRFLTSDHPFRKSKTTFYKGRVEDREAPPRLSGTEVWEQVSVLPKATAFVKKDKKQKGWSIQSIFWELPYWKHHLIRHNLDVMHIEKNFFDQVINTVMDVKGRTSDTISSKKDMKLYCLRRNLEIVVDENGRELAPCAPYVLDKSQRAVLCEWVQELKFPDGYASDFGRCVDHKGMKLFGMKSHDCHVFMERLIPVAFKHLLPSNVWSTLTELSQFFRDLCSSTIDVERMVRLEKNIPGIICKLEKIFPPSFFNSMEHLPIHLPYEAKVGGSVQYRWMYPFERFLNHLKRNVGNKARVEGSICNSYLLGEIATFCCNYFDDHVNTKSRDISRNACPPTHNSEDKGLPELFQVNGGRATSKGVGRYLNDKEFLRTHLYVLANCGVLDPFERKFEDFIIQEHNLSNPGDVWVNHEHRFPKWLRDHVIGCEGIEDVVHAMAMEPSKKVNTYHQYYVNGYNFHTREYGMNKSTVNHGVCVKGVDNVEFYGTLEKIIEICYCGEEREYKAILFDCEWVDPISGMKVHPQYKLVEVNTSKKYRQYDPFVLAHQVEQVYFASYPSMKKDCSQWKAVFNVKARSVVDAPVDHSFFQEDLSSEPATLSECELPDVDELLGDEEVLDVELDMNSSEEEFEDVDNDNEEEDFLTGDETDDEDDMNFNEWGDGTWK